MNLPNPHMRAVLSACLFASSVLLASPSHSQSYVLNPKDDGSVYFNGGVINFQYLLAGRGIQGVEEFPLASVHGYIKQAKLSVNPYSLPLLDFTVEVYGYKSTDGILTSADNNAGTFLGILNLPTNVGFGQDVFFDVTSFLRTVDTPYVGFNLRAESTVVFSSLENNYGHPSQLSIVAVPEPNAAVFTMTTASLMSLGLLRRRKRAA